MRRPRALAAAVAIVVSIAMVAVSVGCGGSAGTSASDRPIIVVTTPVLGAVASNDGLHWLPENGGAHIRQQMDQASCVERGHFCVPDACTDFAARSVSCSSACWF